MESLVVFFPCRNLEETKQFYTQIVGLTFYMDQGGCYLFDSGKGYLGFTENNEKVKLNAPCISFNLKNQEAVNQKYEEMKKLNIDGLTCPQKHPLFPVYSFFMKDPNGYTVEFQKILIEGNQNEDQG